MNKKFVFWSLFLLLLIVFCVNFIDISFIKAKYIFIRTNMLADKNIAVLNELKKIKNQELEEIKKISNSSDMDKNNLEIGQKIIERITNERIIIDDLTARAKSHKDLVLILENLWQSGYYSKAEKEKIYSSAAGDLAKLKEQLNQLKEYKKQIQKLSRANSALFYFFIFLCYNITRI